MKLGPLLLSAKIAVPEGAEELDVHQIAYDSRRVKERSLFVAISGFHRDGHDFAADAVTRGAVAVVGERPIRKNDDGASGVGRHRGDGRAFGILDDG
ncbi:MAG: hypothetical protein E6H84_14315 [Chloroflexi bacterium]|nr:MAG: hypothetical protein E6H84_14315 [Chloroflexota bacterium]